MPHIHVRLSKEIAAKVDGEEVLRSLVETLSQLETIRPESVKAYLSVHDAYAVGQGHPPELAHCTVAILDGRPPEIRQQIADRMYESFRSLIAQAQTDVGITLEVREMAKEQYRK